MPLEDDFHKRLKEYRAQTFRSAPGLRVKTKEEAVLFANERGFIYFWPIQDILMPSLWVAVAGDRPVADEHDDPGHVSWGWKDSLLGQRKWYYAKVLRKKATIISLQAAPYFYALSENYGAPEEDYLTLYEQGRLTQEAKTVFETLLKEGPLDTVALRKAARMSSRDSDSRFNKALVDLQADFKVLPVGVTQSGRWHYAFAYDITPRHFPDLPEKAHAIREDEARRKLAEIYIRSVGAAQDKDLTRLFGWKPDWVEAAVKALEREGMVRCGVELEGRKGNSTVLTELL